MTRLPLVSACLTLVLAGCAMLEPNERMRAHKHLDGPFNIGISLDKTSGFAGEHVTATIQITNRGDHILLVPLSDEFPLGYERRTELSWERGEDLLPCTGMSTGRCHVAVAPGRSVAYGKTFIVPGTPGTISIYTSARRSVRAPFEVNEPIKAPE